MSVIVEQKFVLNTAGAREEKLDGVDFLVVPLVMMTPGVRTANAGKLLYEDDELGKDPEGWNHFPVVVYHPEKNGQLISARTPEITEKRRVGYVFNAAYNSKLSGEAWFDVAKTDRVDKTIIPRIKAGDTLEVSTGMKLDVANTAGEHNGETYEGVAKYIRPDHLAILPDRKGACSTEAGCGCGVNVANRASPLVGNEASFLRIQEQIQSYMYKATDYYAYVRDVYKDFFIYSANGKLYRRNYSADADGNVTVSDGTATEVQWVQEYRDTKGNFVGNVYREMIVNKAQMINDIIAANVGYEEGDRKAVEAMPDAMLLKVHTRLPKKVGEIVGNNTLAPVPTPVSTPAPVVPPVRGVMTPQEWLVANNAPPIMTQLVNSAINQQQKLVANIQASPLNKLSAQALASMSLDDLQGLQEMLTQQATVQQAVGNQAVAWYGGQGASGSQVVGNAGQQPLAPADLFATPQK